MIEITGTLLFVCAMSGAAGGLVNHRDRRRKGLMVSLVTAVTVSLPVAWLYMWVALPNLNAAFPHDKSGAVLVALIAGAAGATGLKAAAKRFGLDLFDSATCEQARKTTVSITDENESRQAMLKMDKTDAEALQHAYNQQ